MKPIWLLWWSCLSLCGHCNPGVVLRVTQKWMDYILSEGTEVFRHMLKRDHLPNIIGSTRVFGNVDYAITGISIEEFETSHAMAVLVPPADIQLNVEGAMAKVFGQWRVKHWLIKDNGDFSLSISGVTLKAQFTTLKDSAARPSVSISSCLSKVKNAKVHLSGGASWLYNLFTGFLESPIRDNLNEKLCLKVNEAIKILQNELETFQVTADLDVHNKIDYSVINPPRVQKTHIDLDLKHPRALWLRTDDYRAFIPNVKKYYPKSEAIMFTMKTTKSPEILLTSQLTLKLEGILEALVVLPNMLTKQFFATSVQSTFTAGMLRLSNLNMKVSFSTESFKFQDFRSYVGQVDVAELEQSLGHMLQESVVQAINSGLSGGIPMPSFANITVQESVISVTPGCLLMSVDVYYIPWKELVVILPEHGSSYVPH
ncbi:bactericidal permeability-increasing protein-like isoform X2 [Phyllobates terribilis]|uniref:bactericidal permeability-increasing protein-like isoform X2 n=1 Tax=Phyllobates terribilis TaxID=111132 RepID=UPI003CCB66D3